MKKVLWVKFGWSDWYRGGLVDGNFGWLNDSRGTDDEGLAHEAFNFRPGPDGTYYCYVPPQKGEYAPSNADPNGWTVICLAKNPKHKGIHIVGWYENAHLHGEWLHRPENSINVSGDANEGDSSWSYCITSKTAYFVPPERRLTPFSHGSVRQGKYSFLEGPDVKPTANKRNVLAILESRLKVIAPFAIKNPNEENLPDPEIDAADPLKGFGTAEHRKTVEKAAERAVIEYYTAKGFSPERVTHLPVGYDFVFTKGKSTLHVEVKGTASTIPQFFLTRNEHGKGLQSNPDWRLAMVTSALSDAPLIAIYDAKQVKQSFDVDPYVFLGKFIPVLES